MKALVIYDSVYGNTKIIATAIAKGIGDEARCMHVKEMKPAEFENLELLVAGSPINAWRPTPAIMAVIETIPSAAAQQLKAAAFDTRVKLFISGNGARKIARALKKKGIQMIAPPEGYYVRGSQGPLFTGESVRAMEWGKSLARIYNSLKKVP